LLLLGDEDQPHAAFANLFQQLVRPDDRAGPLADRVIDGGNEFAGRFVQKTACFFMRL
jgi:hypothetical protein